VERRRRLSVRPRFIFIAALVGSLAACTANPHSTAHVPATGPGSVSTLSEVAQVVAVGGDSADELAANINAGVAAGKSVRYVTVKAATGTDNYSVYAQIAHSKSAVLVHVYGRTHVYRRSTTKVFYSADPSHELDIASLPLINVPTIDKALSTNASIGASSTVRLSLCAHCDYVVGYLYQSGPVKAQFVASLKDPWQINPDYSFWKSGSDVKLASSSTRSAQFLGDCSYGDYNCGGGDYCPFGTYIDGNCYYGIYSPGIGGSGPSCGINSQTAATFPTNVTRTTIGVGEAVNLASSAGSTWSVNSGGSLNTTSGSAVTFTAGDLAGGSTVTVSGSGCASASITFSIITPTLLIQRANSGIEHKVGSADIGIQQQYFFQPETVSFVNLFFEEEEVIGSATGYYACNGATQTHMPGAPLAALADVPGHGYPVGTDAAYSGSCFGNQFLDGSLTFNIPMDYALTSTGVSHRMNITANTFTSTVAGALNASKGASTGSTTVNSPTSSF